MIFRSLKFAKWLEVKEGDIAIQRH